MDNVYTSDQYVHTSRVYSTVGGYRGQTPSQMTIQI